MNLADLFRKSTIWERVFVVALTIILLFICFSSNRKEGFDGSQKSAKFSVHRDGDIYDDFYVSVYDDLVFCKEKNNFEITTFIKETSPTKDSRILDIGSGTGHHVNVLTAKGFSTLGIDTSPAMVKSARRQFPESQFKVEDASNAMAFASQQFTHITCFYFTVYYFKNKHDFFNNCFQWLEPNGYLVVHLVNRAKFDPIVPAGDPLTLISAQRFAKQRITKTKVKFHGYDYQSNFDYDAKNSNAIMNEEFINTQTGTVRKNEHKLYMESQKDILAIAKRVGFKLKGHVDMSSCQYHTQYLYILRK